MMRRLFTIRRTIPAACLLLLCSAGYAQTDAPTRKTGAGVIANGITVTGKITDAATGKVLRGASIKYKNLSAAITDSLGAFSITVPHNRVTVVVTADGYGAKEIALKGSNSITAALHEDGFTSFYDDITTPFGTGPQSHTTAAATSVQTGGAWNNVPETPDAYLQGRVAGLNAIRRSGTPNTGANLFLRGYSSLYAANQPLIIVDGVYYDNGTYGTPLSSGFYNNPLSFIDLKDIDNITVLKDATATYGAKGANGAIIITTARARQEATKIDAAVYGGITFAPQQIPVLSVADYRTYLSEILQSKGLTAAQMQALPYMNDDPSGPGYYRNHYNNNWQDKVFSNSYTKNAYLKITGGDNIARYGLSIGYLNNKGALDKTELTRYNMRFNADLNLSKRLTASANVSYFRNEQGLKNTGINPATNPIYAALIKAPFLPASDVADNGVESPSLAASDTFGVSNPLALIRSMSAANQSYRYVGSISFNYLFSKNFSLATTIAVTSQKVRESFFVPERGIVSDTLSNTVAKNRSGAQVLKVFNLFNDTRLTYNKVFNRVHQIQARAGVRYNKSSTEQDYGLGFNSATDQLTGVGYGLNTLRQVGGTLGTATWLNMYLNAEYNLADKYFISVNGALDGSSRFGKGIDNAGIRISGRTLGAFPSVAAAWLLSSENFMAGVKAVDLLKLRVSYGATGNDDIGNNTARKYYVPQNLLGISGLVRGSVSDERLRWEKVSKFNAGFDLSLFNERLSITGDVYHNKTTGMIVYQPGVSVSGQDYIISNTGAMRTSGLEAAVSVRIIDQKSLKWDMGFNIARYRSKVTKLPDYIFTSFAGGTIITAAVYAPNLYYGYATGGVYASDAAAATAGLRNKNADGTTTAFRGGDVVFKDLNGDKIIDESDRQIVGNPNPDFFGGISTKLSCKNWTLDALATFTQGGDLYNYARRQLESVSGYANQTEAVLRRWKTNGQVTDVPRAAWGDPMGNSRFSDRWIEDGSYFRLKTVSLSYNVPIRPTALKYITVYVTGNNVFTLTKYLGYDPEFSAASGVYGQGADTFLEPQYRSVQAGVRIGL